MPTAPRFQNKLSTVGFALTFQTWENWKTQLATGRCRTGLQDSSFHRQPYCPQSIPSTVNRDESVRISLPHSNCHPTPCSLGLDAQMGRWQTKFHSLAASQHKTYSVAKQEDKMGFTTAYTFFLPRELFSRPVIMDELGAGGIHDYVMSEGRRQAEGEPSPSDPFTAPLAHKDVNYRWRFECFNLLWPTHSGLAFQQPVTETLRVFRASIHWLAKP